MNDSVEIELLKKLEDELRSAALVRYVRLQEELGLSESPYERFKHSAELNERFLGSYELYCDWLNVGEFTEFEVNAKLEWMKWAEGRFPGLREEADGVLKLMGDSDLEYEEAVKRIRLGNG